ncbi:MAG TPA: YggS family pyridoxal phosphate-dependent enzyme [Terriglobia bacterium]|nr:YggS family pyridoxal phosphate-dependent enzyme [Terriglobia bacterium]
MAESVRENIARVQERIADACRRAGRRREQVRLVAVSKTVAAGVIREAYEAGLRDFGENRVQEASAKRGALADLDITWHLIGHLQTNKAKAARELFHCVHSVDSSRVAERLGFNTPAKSFEFGQSGEPGRLKVLIEVNLGGEAAKSGIAEGGALELARAVTQLGGLDLCGLMLVPPYFEEAERSRPLFSRLRELATVINSAGLPGLAMNQLSMGMSHDFEVAIEEGATLVRVGTAIFGSRS